MQKTLSAVDSLLAEKDFYSAHQKYRSSAARLLRSDPASQDAASLLFTGARTLLQHHQYGSATDLALQLVRLYSSANQPCTPARRVQIQQLLAMYPDSDSDSESGSSSPPSTTTTSSSWRKSLADAAFQWACSPSLAGHGSTLLHAYYGQLLVSKHLYSAAEPHLLLVPTPDAAHTLADALFAWYSAVSQQPEQRQHPTTQEDPGKYAARAVFSYLEQGYILPARTFLSRFLANLRAKHAALFLESLPLVQNRLHQTTPHLDHDTDSPSSLRDEIQITSLPSLNFLQLLIRTCQIGNESSSLSKNTWITLLNRYDRELPWLKEPDVLTSRHIIAESYFGIPNPKRPQNDMLSNLMGNLFGADPSSAAKQKRGPGKFSIANSSTPVNTSRNVVAPALD